MPIAIPAKKYQKLFVNIILFFTKWAFAKWPNNTTPKATPIMYFHRLSLLYNVTKPFSMSFRKFSTWLIS